MAEGDENVFGGLGKDAFKGFAENARAALDDALRLVDAKKDLKQLKAFDGDISDIKKLANELRKIELKRDRSEKAADKARENAELARKTALDLEEESAKLAAKAATSYGRNKHYFENAAYQLSRSAASSKKMASDFDDIAKNIDYINSQTKFFDRASKFVKSIPGGKFLSGPFEKAAEAAGEMAKNGEGITKTYTAGALSFVSALTDALAPLSLLSGLATADKEIADISRNLNISRADSENIRSDFASIANDSQSIGVTTQTVVAATQALNDKLGISVTYSKQLVTEMSKLTNLLGVADAARLAQITQATGQNLANFTSEAVESGLTLEGVNLSSRDILDDISKLSSEILIDFKNNPKELGRAVAEARKLGTSLEAAKASGSQLLDFQSSIANELEAELFTGKQINLEQARLAALRGDDLTLMKELNKNIGSISDFENMSVLARQSLAKSLGMEVNQVSEILLKREAINAVGEKANELNAKQIAAARELQKDQGIGFGEALKRIGSQVSAQKAIELSMIKIQSVIGDIATMIMPLLDGIAYLVRTFAESSILKGVLGVGIAAKALSKSLKLIKGKTLGTYLNPMIVKMVGAGAASGTSILGRVKKGLASVGSRVGLPNSGFTRAMGAGAGLGFAAGGEVVRRAGNRIAGSLEKSGKTGAARAVDVTSGIGQGALYGAAIGSIVPGVGTALGAAVGGAVGLIAGGVEAANRRQETQVKQKDLDQKEMLELLRQGNTLLQTNANKETKLYMDSRYLGQTQALGVSQSS